MDSHVIQMIASTSGSAEVDLAMFEQWLEEVEPFTPEKLHVQKLISLIIADETQPQMVRAAAVQVLVKSSDVLATIRSVPHWQELAASVAGVKTE